MYCLGLRLESLWFIFQLPAMSGVRAVGRRSAPAP